MNTSITRRGILAGLGAGATLAAVPAWAQGHSMRRHNGPPIRVGFDEVSGEVIDLAVAGAGDRFVYAEVLGQMTGSGALAYA